MGWIVYIVRCSDGTYYTGIASDLSRRLWEHNTDNKLGSRFVRTRRPVILVYKEIAQSRSAALKRESEIKGWSRKKKKDLITGQSK